MRASVLYRSATGFAPLQCMLGQNVCAFNQGVNQQQAEVVTINWALMRHAMFNEKFANIQL